MDAMTIEDSWLRIENWLCEFAPAAYASLPPAAGSDAVRVAERQCGLVFPEDLVASLRRHDGAGECLLPGNYRLFAAAEIAKDYVWWIGSQQRDVPDELRYWRSSWLPLAGDGAGDSLFVEMATGDQHGRIGAHAHGDGGRFDDRPQYTSLQALLSWAAQALSVGSATDVLDYVLATDEQGLPYWEDADAQQDGVLVVWDMAALENRHGGL
ncbi:SMI1/KNR4 family protein [Streptomyces sp. NPDC048436]|uniref:SMI1/KNR4 family protein n=1 Tax=Streptomyces sp. NPDC048436 TaxID=3365550 RepID=UPI003710E0DE